jgi:hypothetical protein
MTELFLFFSFLVFSLTLLILVKNSRAKKRCAFIHLTILFIYSFYFLFGLLYGEFGPTLGLMFYLSIILLIHWLFMLGQLTYLLSKAQTKT